MQLKGRRIHIAGSASPTTDPVFLEKVHALLAKLTDALIIQGANFLIPFGKEPFLEGQSSGPSVIFDWTIAERVQSALARGGAAALGTYGKLVATVATTKTADQIPLNRRPIYEALKTGNAVETRYLDSGWTAGAIQRQIQSDLGDILIAVSGGQGVEHLAVAYSRKGKPVIPLDISLGASQGDGSGGAARLFNQALSKPEAYFRVESGESAADLLERTQTDHGNKEPGVVVEAIVNLLLKLEPPRVFYVRLLNKEEAAYTGVEDFFRGTVDSLVEELGYSPLQMGMGPNEFAWMNQAIFDSIHRSSVIVVDLTGSRPNCFMELGYALGNRQRVILTAHKDTKISFDAAALEAFLWHESDSPATRLNDFRTHWQRNIDMPELVRERKAF